MPFSGPPPSSQQTSLDKTSIIRLTLAGLKSTELISNGETFKHYNNTYTVLCLPNNI